MPEVLPPFENTNPSNWFSGWFGGKTVWQQYKDVEIYEVTIQSHWNYNPKLLDITQVCNNTTQESTQFQICILQVLTIIRKPPISLNALIKHIVYRENDDNQNSVG